jgi:histone-lysine N-methyltransferase ASH1L
LQWYHAPQTERFKETQRQYRRQRAFGKERKVDGLLGATSALKMVEVLCEKRKVPQTPKGWMLRENHMGRTRVKEARNDKEIARPQKAFDDVVNKVGR